MKTYICHYPKLKERIEYLVPNLIKNGFEEIEVINGVDRLNISESDKEKFSNDINLVKDRLRYTKCTSDYDILSESDGAIVANFLTHLEIWEKISRSNDDFALVLEDDALISNDFIYKWNKLITTLPEKLDIGYLHEGCGFTVKNKLFVETNENQIWYDCGIKESRTCCSYIISKDFCTKILLDIYPIVLAIDHELNYIQKKLNANVYWTSPALFIEGSGVSYKSSLR
jgi:hypothetical protein